MTGAGGFNVTVPVDGNGIYRVGPVSDGTSLVTPHKDYFSFAPPQSSHLMADANIDNADFAATPPLQFISAVKHAELYTADDGSQYRGMQVPGYNFVVDQTRVTIGSSLVFAFVYDATILFTLAPPAHGRHDRSARPSRIIPMRCYMKTCRLFNKKGASQTCPSYRCLQLKIPQYNV